MADYTVSDIDLHVSGQGDDVIVMIHGWPDTYRLWDAQVQTLKASYTCVRFTLPGFDCQQPRRPVGFSELIEIIGHIVDTVSPQRPVTLMLHDWGCWFGYQFAIEQPEKVSRIIGLDIGDATSKAFLDSLSLRDKFLIFGYQIWLAAAWKIDGRVGDFMTRALAQVFRAPGKTEDMGSQMNYPYYIYWAGAYGSYRHAKPFFPEVPMLYVYGSRKPFMFHSEPWINAIAQKQDSQVLAMNTGHWMMKEQPEALNRAILDWLNPA